MAGANAAVAASTSSSVHPDPGRSAARMKKGTAISGKLSIPLNIRRGTIISGSMPGRIWSPVRIRVAIDDTPMTRAAFHSPLDPSTKGRIQLSLWKPIDQPYADWMHAIVSVDGSRPAFRLLDFKQGFRPLLHDQGTSLDAFPLCPSASPHPGRCPDPTQPSYPAVCFIYDCFLLSLICGIFLVVLIREEG